MLKRTSLNFINKKYVVDDSHKIKVDEQPIITMKVQKDNETHRNYLDIKYPKELFVRESLLKKINYKFDKFQK